jgi:hypothetical protein
MTYAKNNLLFTVSCCDPCESIFPQGQRVLLLVCIRRCHSALVVDRVYHDFYRVSDQFNQNSGSQRVDKDTFRDHAEPVVGFEPWKHQWREAVDGTDIMSFEDPMPKCRGAPRARGYDEDCYANDVLHVCLRAWCRTPGKESRRHAVGSVRTVAIHIKAVRTHPTPGRKPRLRTEHAACPIEGASGAITTIVKGSYGAA